MASPAKAPKEGEDVVEGFIHNVSPRRQSKNGSPYFTAVLQSARQEYHRAVVFAMDKQGTFSQAEKNGNAVKLRNVRRSISFTDPDGFDVLCSRGTAVEVTTLPFLRSTPSSCRRMTVAEVKGLGPKQKVGEVRGRVRLQGSVSRTVSVNGADCELKEVKICDGTGEVKVTLWDRFADQAEGGGSYAFKNLSTRDRDGAVALCTGPTSTVERIADMDVPEEESGQRADTTTALVRATIKGIEVTIQRRCTGCQSKQRQWVEKSKTHRCERCNLKQASLSFHATLGGRATVSAADGEESVVLTSAALSTYLRGVGLGGLMNDAEGIEDHFLQAPAFDLTVNVNGFLVSIQASGTGERSEDGEEDRGGAAIAQA